MAALEGIKVLDFGRYVAGPYCATLLADFGADVIRVERVEGSEDRDVAPLGEHGDGGSLFLQMGRNKRSLALDISSPKGRAIIHRLIASTDVVIANVPDAALKAMGLDYELLTQIKPDIILANVSAFGSVGPWSDRPGFDSVGQAMCGSAYLSGSPDQPLRTPTTWVDHSTALYLTIGVMMALVERTRTGCGQKIEGSLLGSAIAINSTSLIEQAVTAPSRVAMGNRSALNGPTDMFQTTDGWILTQVVGNPLFRRWTRLMGEDSWLEDPRFKTDVLRGINGAVLSKRMADWCTGKSTAIALAALSEGRIPAAPVLSPQETLQHPQVAAMNFLIPTEIAGLDIPVPLVRTPLDLSVSPPDIRSAPPRIGEHNDPILTELGFSEDDICSMRDEGLISG
jgi:crotonobetainyl-CoA:carnitine CoA-transferase CaiB-like acyl-CoA transferase